MIEETISHYRVLEKLGSGGMGDVYKAEDTKLRRTVALKFLPRELMIDDEARRRFINEAQAASSLDHSHIGTIFEIDEVDGKSFIAMAYYEGGTLRDRLSEGRLPIEETVNVALQLARGLAKAHSSGIIHRDVKPANIMLTDEGQLKIVDFGLAKLAGQTLLTRTGTTLGTVAYMSPEQASGQTVDHRSDIWSAGVILYEMITGERPFKGDYEQAVLYSLVNTEPEYISRLRSDTPAALERIVDKALQKDQSRRYQSADELAMDLEAVLESLRSSDTRPAVRILGLSRRQKRVAGWSGAALTGVLAFVLALVLGRGVAENHPVTIAVLPLALESEDSDAAWFSDGMTEALITDLAQIENLRVISRRSVMQYKSTDKSASDIAKVLKVDFVVEGSVGRQDNIVRVSARLVDAASDQYVWADRFDSDFSEVLDTQARIAKAIAEKIHGQVSPDDLKRLEVRRTVDPETYEAYLKGIHHIGKYTPDDIRKGLAFLHEAVEKSPGDALAWAGLAIGYITVGHGPTPAPDVKQRARAAATRAVTLDSTLAEAQAAFAIVKDYYDWDWDVAERAFKRSIDLNPSLAMSHYHYAWMLIMFDRMDEAIREHELAVELDPLFPPQVAWMGDVYRMAGRYEDALREADKALELGDRSGIAHLVKGNVYLDLGELDSAIAEHERMVDQNPVWRGFLGATYASAGRAQDALKIVAAIEADGVKSIDAFQLAFLYAQLGDADEAFRWVDFEPPHAFLPWLATRWAPLYSLRDDPRYEVFLERLDLPQHRASEEKPFAQGPGTVDDYPPAGLAGLKSRSGSFSASLAPG